MKLFNFLKTHKLSFLSLALVVCAAALGADSAFAMAVVEEVNPSPDPNPSEKIEDRRDADGNPAEQPEKDEQGNKTQQPGRAVTRTDLRDMRLLSDDFNKDVDEFRRWRFPEETLFLALCTPVKVNDPVYKHGHVGSTDLDVIYVGEAPLKIGKASGASSEYNATTQVLTVSASMFENVNQFMPFGTATIEGTIGYEKTDEGYVPNGELGVFIEKHEVDGDVVKMYVINPPMAGNPLSEIPPQAVFHVAAPACAESQMHVNSDAFNPVAAEDTLQKKIATLVVTKASDEADTKFDFKTKSQKASVKENFKRKCARSHWNGTPFRRQVFVKETGNREEVFGEKGILRQITKHLGFTGEFGDDTLLAMTTLMFGENASNDHAQVFCGKKALTRLIKLVNSNPKYKDVGKVEVNEYGVKIRKYADNFGTLEFIWAQILDDLGKSDYMAVLDLEHAERPYISDNKETERDMSKTGEAREAMEYNLVREDCITLKGHNSILVYPAALATAASRLNPNATTYATWIDSENLPSDKTKKYLLMNACGGFDENTIIEFDADLNQWKVSEGEIALA